MSENENNEMKNEVIVTLEGRDTHLGMERLGLTMNSTQDEILDIVSPIIGEEHGVSLKDEYGEISYMVQKATNSNTIYVIPKTPAG